MTTVQSDYLYLHMSQSFIWRERTEQSKALWKRNTEGFRREEGENLESETPGSEMQHWKQYQKPG